MRRTAGGRDRGVRPGGGGDPGALGGGIPRRSGGILRGRANLVAELLGRLADLLAGLFSGGADLLSGFLGGGADLLGGALHLLLVLLVAGGGAERPDGEQAREADVRERAQAG